MFKIKIIEHLPFYDYLNHNRIIIENREFSFFNFEHFINVTTTFLTDYVINEEIKKLIVEELVNNEETETVLSYINPSFKTEIEYFVSNTLMQTVKEKSSFSISQFIVFFMGDIQNQIHTVLFESLPYIYNKSSEIILGEEKTDVLYMIIQIDGSITIEKKDCTEVSSYPYYQQEQAVAEALYINPTLLIVYDATHLLKPEMVVCLKKILRKKVVFLEEEYPHYKN